MIARGRAALVALAALAVGYALVRIFVHSSALLTPALITPEMDAHRTLSPSLDARVARLWEERVAPADRPDARLIALTFDDGPYPVETPLLLDRLRELNVPATFFLIGRDVEEQPEISARLIAQGYEVADHTRTHPNLDALTPERVQAELLGGSGVLARFTGAASARRLFRPPHGRYTEETIRVAQALGYTIVLWNDDPGDWRSMSAAAVAAHVLAHATAPEILLLHSGRRPTTEALATIVPTMRAAGYEFVTVGELLRRVPAQAINHPRRLRLTSGAPETTRQDAEPTAP